MVACGAILLFKRGLVTRRKSHIVNNRSKEE
jgi:hypothetical protein